MTSIHRVGGIPPHPRMVLLTGSPGAVARPRFPQNVACGFPAPRSSTGGSQHCKGLQLSVRASDHIADKSAMSGGFPITDIQIL